MTDWMSGKKKKRRSCLPGQLDISGVQGCAPSKLARRRTKRDQDYFRFATSVHAGLRLARGLKRVKRHVLGPCTGAVGCEPKVWHARLRVWG
eukprot:scaffold1785_cov247-Pinguiococcus_pyrenoidosus.AAC.20